MWRGQGKQCELGSILQVRIPWSFCEHGTRDQPTVATHARVSLSSFQDGLALLLEEECACRHYNLSAQREFHHVDSYGAFWEFRILFWNSFQSVCLAVFLQWLLCAQTNVKTCLLCIAWLKLGDCHWYGLQGKRDVGRAAHLYGNAAAVGDPQVRYSSPKWIVFFPFKKY